MSQIRKGDAKLIMETKNLKIKQDTYIYLWNKLRPHADPMQEDKQHPHGGTRMTITLNHVHKAQYRRHKTFIDGRLSS